MTLGSQHRGSEPQRVSMPHVGPVRVMECAHTCGSNDRCQASVPGWVELTQTHPALLGPSVLSVNPAQLWLQRWGWKMSRGCDKLRWKNSQGSSACRKREFGPGPRSYGTWRRREAWHHRYNSVGLTEGPGDFKCACTAAGDYQTAARPNSHTPSIHVCLHRYKLASGGYLSLVSIWNLDHQSNDIRGCYFGGTAYYERPAGTYRSRDIKETLKRH